MCKVITNALGMTPKMPAMPTIPALPAVQQVVQAPTGANPSVAPSSSVAATDAAEAERKRVLAMKGRASTVLTSGAGDTSAVSIKAPVATGAKTLLGA